MGNWGTWRWKNVAHTLVDILIIIYVIFLRFRIFHLFCLRQESQDLTSSEMQSFDYHFEMSRN